MPDGIVADARPRRRAPPPGAGLGLRDQVGRGARDRVLPPGGVASREPQPARDHRQVPRAGRALTHAWARAARCSTGRSWRSTPTGARASRPSSSGCRSRARAQARRRMKATPCRLRDLRPAVAGRPLADGRPLQRAPRAAGGARLAGPSVQVPDYVAGRGRELLAGRHRAGARGRGRQAAHLRLPTRQAQRGLDQDQAPRPPGVRGRRMAARQGLPQPPRRRAAARRPRRRTARCATPGASAAASASASSIVWRACSTRWARKSSPFSGAGGLPARSPASASRSSSPRCRSASGPATGACATRSISACARTSPPRGRARGPGRGGGRRRRRGRRSGGEGDGDRRRSGAAEDRADALGDAVRARRRARAEALEPRQGALPGQRLHQATADRLLRRGGRRCCWPTSAGVR